MIDKYATRRNAEGQGGNVYVTMFMSKNGKACCRVFDPNSEAAKESVVQPRQHSKRQVTSRSNGGAPIYYMTARVAFKKRRLYTSVLCG